MSSTLTVKGNGHRPVRDVINALDEIENAYNSLIVFERTSSALIHDSESNFRFRDSKFPPPYLFHNYIQIPPTEMIPYLILPKERLILARVKLSSPGSWEFIGKLNPLEVVRQWLCDDHERRKDKEYREKYERDRLRLENALLENRVIKERMDLLRQLGIPETDQVRLLNQFVLNPLRRLEQYQDKEIFTGAEIKTDPEDKK